MTQRLYDDDSHLRMFAATTTGLLDEADVSLVSLDRTAFYPGGGGQPDDRGVLGGQPVLGLEERAGEIWHRLERGIAPGSAVEASIDWSRRFDHMQQHTGQHILSRSFVEVAKADTRSFHLGETVVTIDVDHPGPDEALLRRVEARANEIVWEDREVRTHVVTPEAARRFPLRKPPDMKGAVRVVEVSDYDWSACGGTHVARTGEVGLLAILGTERYKGGTRVSFVAGGRALRRLQATGDLLRRICLEFTAGEADLPRAVARLKEERERLLHRLKPLVRASLEGEADRLLEGALRGPHGPVVARRLEERDPEELGTLAALIAARGGIALLVSGGGSPRAHFSAPTGTIAVGALLGEICRTHGGRGGGRPESAQGTIPREHVDEALRQAEAAATAGREKGTTV